MRKFSFFLPLFVIIVLCINTVMQINQLELIGDGVDNFKLSYHLAKNGVMSTGNVDAQQKLMPSNAREPFPILLSALWIKSIPALAQENSPQALKKGKKFILLKLQNIIYIAILLVGIYFLSHEIFKKILIKPINIIASTLVLLLCYACIHTLFVNNLLTEFHAEMLIVWFIWCWLRAWETQKNTDYIIAGLLLGALILTKAAFMYIAMVSLLFFTLWLTLVKTQRTIILQHFLILIVAGLTVFPWFARNYVQLGVWEHTQRGPVVLLVRAYKNAMSHEEFKGAFYAYAPASLKNSMSKITGFNEEDRLIGGRLQRLTRVFTTDFLFRDAGNENAAISYYIKATTHHQNVHLAFKNKNINPIKARILADESVKNEALNKINNNIPAHLKAALVFAWRGAWPCNTVDGRWSSAMKKQPMWQELLPFLGLLAMFYYFASGLISKNVSHVILCMLGVSSFTFYALATHFLPRYSEMFIAIWVILFCYFCVNMLVNIIPAIKPKSV